MSSLNRVVGWTEILLWNGLLNWMVRQSDQPSRDSRSCILKGHIWWTLYLDGSISKLVKEISCLSSKAEIQGLVQEFLFQKCSALCLLMPSVKTQQEGKGGSLQVGWLIFILYFFSGKMRRDACHHGLHLLLTLKRAASWGSQFYNNWSGGLKTLAAALLLCNADNLNPLSIPFFLAIPVSVSVISLGK